MKKKLRNCYWPEFNRYCGCCDLSTGIYIRSLITLLISTISLIVNCAILDYLFSIGTIIYSANLTTIDDYVATSRDEPERDLATLQLIYKSLLVYYIMWISVKAIYVVTVVFTAYAIFKKNTWMLKLLLFISIPNWVLDFFISFVGTIMLSDGLKVILVICNLSEGYNILAINSEYKKMRGKSRLAAEDIESEPRTEQIYVNNCITQHTDRYHNGYTQVHCRSCTCFENTQNIDNNEVSPEDVIASEHIMTTVNENSNDAVNISNTNALNSNLNEDTFNDILRAEGSIVRAIDSDEGHAVRPDTIQIKAKEDLSDIPVIYDEQQLNVGLSPVFEDRRINSPND